MYELLTHDRRQTQTLLRRLNIALSGAPVESASLPTGELLVLMRENEAAGKPHAVYLLGASALLPVALLKKVHDPARAPLLLPRYALQLMRGRGSMTVKSADRSALRRTLKQLTN